MHIVLAAGLLAAGLSASAATRSFNDSLSDPNAFAVLEVELTASADMLVQSWGYGGSAAAPGGVNGAGSVISPGGFDAYLSLFRGWGGGATFVTSNDDGPCPPASASPACSDPQLFVSSLSAGRYSVVVTQWNNFSFAENQGQGTLGDGFIGLAADFGGRTAAWAVDVQSAALVPEPSIVTLLMLGLTVLATQSFRRNANQGESR